MADRIALSADFVRTTAFATQCHLSELESLSRLLTDAADSGNMELDDAANLGRVMWRLAHDASKTLDAIAGGSGGDSSRPPEGVTDHG